MFGSVELIRCQHCNTEIPAQSVFCPACGKSVVNAPTDNTVQKIVCPNCKRPNDSDERYCSYCFYDLSKEKPQEMKVILKPRKVDGVTLTECVLVNDKGTETQIVCPACKALNDLDEKYCIKCGESLKSEVTKKYCSVCGTENPPDAVFCVNCQHSFEGKKPVDGETYWRCSCGYENDLESEFCVACGKLRNAK
jgi:predicted amidophosphoribosyltransferase